MSLELQHMQGKLDITVLARDQQIKFFCHLVELLQMAHSSGLGVTWENKDAQVRSMLELDRELMAKPPAPESPTGAGFVSPISSEGSLPSCPSEGSSSDEDSALAIERRNRGRRNDAGSQNWMPLRDKRRYERARRVKDAKPATSLGILPQLREKEEEEEVWAAAEAAAEPIAALEPASPKQQGIYKTLMASLERKLGFMSFLTRRSETEVVPFATADDQPRSFSADALLTYVVPRGPSASPTLLTTRREHTN